MRKHIISIASVTSVALTVAAILGLVLSAGASWAGPGI